ncbi:MAG: MBL fold metallo-hydrolase, partial [Candidatus Micrarchaeia archaeon]
MLKITFYGGADEVGRSCIEVQEGNHKLLMDCGVKLGTVEEYPLIKRIPKNIIITHTHLDHAAYLPHIFRKPRNITLYMTKPTRDLLQLMIADYMRVSKNSFDNSQVMNNMLKQCKAIDFDEIVDCGGICFSLHRSGHVLGSASVLIHSVNGNLLYTSDLNTRAGRITDAAEFGLKAKTLVIESTYGERTLPSTKEITSQMIKFVNDTLRRNGRVVIPSFAVGRAQEILLFLDACMKNGLIDPAPVYIDGMIKKALRIYRHNIMYAKEELQRSLLVSDVDPFKSRYIFIPQRQDRSDAIEEGSIIVTTSGMLKGGPVLTYLKHLGNDKRNLLLFVGYQAPGTPGRALLDGARKIRLNG